MMACSNKSGKKGKGYICYSCGNPRMTSACQCNWTDIIRSLDKDLRPRPTKPK